MKKPRKNYSLLKHIDFMILDIIFIELSFFIACMVRYGTFMGAMHKYVYMSLILMVAIHLVYVERLVWKEAVRKKLKASKGEVLLFIDEADARL